MPSASRNPEERGRTSSSPVPFPAPPTETADRRVHACRYQEDAYAVHSLAVPQSSLKWNVVDDRLGTGWTPQTLEGFEGEQSPGKENKRQVAYFGVFDGCVRFRVRRCAEIELIRGVEQSWRRHRLALFARLSRGAHRSVASRRDTGNHRRVQVARWLLEALPRRTAGPVPQRQSGVFRLERDGARRPRCLGVSQGEALLRVVGRDSNELTRF